MVSRVYMTLKTSIITGAILVTLLSSGTAVAPVLAGDINCDARPDQEYCTGEEGRDGIIFCGTSGAETDCYDISNMSKQNRPPINEYFAPDESCDFDAYQLKCIPGSEQECLTLFDSFY